MIDETSSRAHESPDTVTFDGTRGRRAEVPTPIPLIGWKDILIRVFREFGENNLSVIAGMYRWARSRRPPQWHWIGIGIGAGLVTVFWVLGSIFFTVHVATSDKYSAPYDSLSAVVISLTWMYTTVLIMLVSGWVPKSTATGLGSIDFFAFDYTFWLNLLFIVAGLGRWRLSKQAPEPTQRCGHHEH